MTPTTWRRGRGLIMFHLTMPSGGAPVAAIARATERFLDHVRTIGAATKLELSTLAGGERAVRWADGLDPASVARRLAGHPDVTRAAVSCQLRCVGVDDRELVIDDGMAFWSQLAELGSPPEQPIELTLVLHTDIYLATSWGDDRDNRALAARNAPRFNAFLAGYLRDTGASVDEVSADDYRDQVDSTGIRLPAPRQ